MSDSFEPFAFECFYCDFMVFLIKVSNVSFKVCTVRCSLPAEKNGTFYFKKDGNSSNRERWWKIRERMVVNSVMNVLKTKLLFSFYMCTLQNCVVLP